MHLRTFQPRSARQLKQDNRNILSSLDSIQQIHDNGNDNGMGRETKSEAIGLDLDNASLGSCHADDVFGCNAQRTPNHVIYACAA